MKKSVLLFIAALMLLAARGWAAPAVGSEPAVISVSVDALDFGDLELGYPVVQNVTVTGENLTGDINLAVESEHAYFYQVTPATITPEQAANGATVKVKCLPVSSYVKPANIRLTSLGAEDVLIPITANPCFPDDMFAYNQTQEFSAYAGGVTSRTGAVRFADAEIPPDPNQPVDRSVGIGDDVDLNLIDLPGVYSLAITGDDASCFTASIVKKSTLINMCTVRVSYIPKSCGTHTATLLLHCATAGVPEISIPLRGESDGILGDLDGNGVLGIRDVTGMINLLLVGEDNLECADFNCDGKVSISDVTCLISRLLSDN